MSTFHSIVSRRDFMKGLGLAGAGLGAAAAATPIFHDLDEMAAQGANYKSPWWIKSVDKPTTEIDWSILNYKESFSRYRSPLSSQISDNRAAMRKGGIEQNISGNSLKDVSIASAFSSGRSKVREALTFPGPDINFLSADWGNFIPPRHTGTPEENLNMVRAALSYFGAPRMGVVELNGNNTKLFDSSVRFESTDEPYVDGKVKVVPTSVKYAIVFSVKQNDVMGRHAFGLAEEGPYKGYAPFLGKATVYEAYYHEAMIASAMQLFLRGIRYQGLPHRAVGGTIPVPWGVLAGNGEQGRVSYITSPEYGNAIRVTSVILTDLPLATTSPMDGGVRNFCKTCKKCADACPSGALTQEEETSWDVLSFEGQPFNRPGIKSWRLNWQKCVDYGSPRDCMRCQVACPFNHAADASIHGLVKMTQATIPMFNGFLANMDRLFDYGAAMDGEEWWNRDLNKWKHDELRGFGNKGW